jgi:glutathione synthase/RimK-type ligase-like ATP-grasp enzyme
MTPQKSVLILTRYGDWHACAVDYVLKMIGVQSHIVNLDEIPDAPLLSADFTQDGDPVLQLGPFSGRASEILSSWTRRIPNSFSLPKNASELDAAYIDVNTSLCVKGFLSLFDDVYPVNHSSSLYASADKFRQLKLAKECGLVIPETLVSNEPDRIFEFLSCYPDACFKPSVTHSWATDNGVFSAKTAKISKELIEDIRSLEIFPHFYQRFIHKRFEYRLTIFGNYSACTRIRTTELSGTAGIDWRVNFDYLRSLDNISVDSRIVEKCKALLKRLGLRFGTFDLAEDHDGKVYFLEVNHSGQWLWQELHCPDCILLEPFARYLASADDNFVWSASKPSEGMAAQDIITAANDDGEYRGFLETLQSPNRYLSTDERPQPVA